VHAAWHLGFVSAALLIGACAEAGKTGSGGTGDAGATDASVLVDAPKATDAAMIDGASSVCATTSTCQTAMDLGSVSGDIGAAMRSASGYQSAWYKVRVTEDDSDVFGIKLSATIRLTSPAASNYDVFVYVNTGSDVVECTTPSGTLTTSGTADSNYIIWGEGSISNGSDDGRTVSIEVRPVSGTCAPAEPWQLVVTGDT
jgi:hypothetical protein